MTAREDGGAGRLRWRGGRRWRREEDMLRPYFSRGSIVIFIDWIPRSPGCEGCGTYAWTRLRTSARRDIRRRSSRHFFTTIFSLCPFLSLSLLLSAIHVALDFA